MRSASKTLSFLAFLNAESAQAADEAAPFLNRPAEEWPSSARLGYGALDYLLGAAHEELDRNPKRAVEWTRLVLRRARHVHVPTEFSLFRLHLIGLAWKEHANALYAIGELRHALAAAARAITIFSKDPYLVVDRATALMIGILVSHELGIGTERATNWLKECRTVFEQAREPSRLLQLDMIEAQMLYASGDYEGARTIYKTALSAAEELKNSDDCARILNNIGQCAVRLKDYPEAVTFLGAAREALEREGMTAAREKVFWGFALLLREHGDLEAAVKQLRRVRRECLANGSVIDAAEVGLDLVELLSATGCREEAARVARELVDVFSNVGIERNLRKALAYLADEAADPRSIPSRLNDGIRHLRKFFRKLQNKPTAPFREPKATHVS